MNPLAEWLWRDKLSADVDEIKRNLSHRLAASVDQPPSAATPSDGYANVTGVQIGGELLHAGPAVRSDYLSQVRRIAPEQLLGREEELEYLSKFCTQPVVESYLWWRADAWAGKSALLSSFVLDPPAGVRVVSFFITARFAGQSDRIAFSEVILEQTLELIGEPMPALLTDATRDAHVLGALERAAISAGKEASGSYWWLTGWTRTEGYLPALIGTASPRCCRLILPAGMRVIVASRPHPPIPMDVPVIIHCASRKSFVRSAVSPHAAIVRQDAERELKRLLRGTLAEQGLLGLLTAAGGGLSGADLAELTGSPTWGSRTV